MGTWDRWLQAGLQAGRKLLHREDEPQKPPVLGTGTATGTGTGTATGTGTRPPTGTPPAEGPEGGPKRGLSNWVEARAQRVVGQAYESHAQDLEQRALRVMSSVYQQTADDLEERAARALRAAIQAEAGRIKEAIEHSIAVKKREVRLSLLVLVVSSLVYLALYWFTSRPDAP